MLSFHTGFAQMDWPSSRLVCFPEKRIPIFRGVVINPGGRDYRKQKVRTGLFNYIEISANPKNIPFLGYINICAPLGI